MSHFAAQYIWDDGTMVFKCECCHVFRWYCALLNKLSWMELSKNQFAINHRLHRVAIKSNQYHCGDVFANWNHGSIELEDGFNHAIITRTALDEINFLLMKMVFVCLRRTQQCTMYIGDLHTFEWVKLMTRQWNLEQEFIYMYIFYSDIINMHMNLLRKHIQRSKVSFDANRWIQRINKWL